MNFTAITSKNRYFVRTGTVLYCTKSILCLHPPPQYATPAYCGLERYPTNPPDFTFPPLGTGMWYKTEPTGLKTPAPSASAERCGPWALFYAIFGLGVRIQTIALSIVTTEEGLI